jgi:hypothetical protein
MAVNLALDRKRINEAACLGFCPPAGVSVPRVMDYVDPVWVTGFRKQLLGLLRVVGRRLNMQSTRLPISG